MSSGTYSSCLGIGGGKAVQLALDLAAISREKLERLREHNLAAMLAAARDTVAVTRRRPGLHEVRQAADIARLPLLTPAELAQGCPPRSDEFLLRGDGAGLVLRSSGTSGRDKVVYHSWEFNQQVELLGVRGVRAALGEPPRRIANCMVPAELNGALTFVQGIGRLLPALTFPLGNKTAVADCLDVIAEHSVDTLVSGPAYGTELLTSAKPEQIGSLRNFLYLGEPMGQAREEAVAAAAPHVTVRSLAYSTTETGPIGYQCTRCSGTTHHVHEDAVLVEIIDENTGEPVRDGVEGEVVVTPLTDTGMALFRYRIGDRGRLSAEPCECGGPARLLTLLGRTAQSLNVDSWTISSDQLMARLTELGVSDPADCQLQILWEFPKYRVRLLLSPRTPDGLTADVVSRNLRPAYQIHQILTSSRCTDFTVARVDPVDFATTERGKVPVLYQRVLR